jgi:tetratricopeptide (TPR) repeat protein
MKLISIFLILFHCSISYCQSDRAKAEQLYTKNDLKGAILILDKAISAGQNDGGIYFDRANYKFELGDFSGAISDYDLAVNSLDSYTQWIAVLQRGQSRHNLKDYAGAIKDYSSIIGPQTKTADMFYHRALSRIALGDVNGACEDLTKAKDFTSYQIKSEVVFAAFNQNCKAAAKNKDNFFDMVRVRKIPQPKTTDRISQSGSLVARVENDPLDNSKIINTPTCDVLSKSTESIREVNGENRYAYMSASMAFTNDIYYLVVFLNEGIGCLNKNETELKVELVNGQSVTFTMVSERMCGGDYSQFVPISRADMNSPNFREKIASNIDLLSKNDWKKMYIKGTDQTSQWGKTPGKSITLIPATASDMPSSISNRLPNAGQFFKKYIAAIRMKL